MAKVIYKREIGVNMLGELEYTTDGADNELD